MQTWWMKCIIIISISIIIIIIIIIIIVLWFLWRYLHFLINKALQYYNSYYKHNITTIKIT